LPWTATPIVVAPLAGIFADRIGTRPVLVTGMLLQGLGLVWFAQVANTGAAYWQMVLPLLVAGIGVSMAIPIASTVVVSAVKPHEMGKASGVNSTMQRLGSAFAVALAAAVFASNGHIGTAASFSAGFHPALTVVAGLSLLGAITALAVRPRPVPAATRAIAEAA
ncbi:MAG TPA: MFS transporter, partial [Candidatus Dormibacteraeota bacterium]|nr:MFS transporter [Candidatus Dormibacteraeota bacterium]